MIASLLITVSALIQLLLTMWFRRRMKREEKTSPLPTEQQHSTWIVMSVRGADPTLADAVKSLLNQDFRDYRMCVVVDNQNDPAASILQSVVDDGYGDRLVIRHLQNPLPHCTLKCSAIAEGVEHILNSDSSVAYFVMVDADSNPPPNMMATLVGVLHSDDGVGLASGNQWFEPNAPASVGSIVRSMWYAGGLFFSMLFQNPWAGAYAMRASDIRRIGLLEVWRESAVDDGPLKALFADHGMSCRSLPSMVMVNRESCTLSFTTRWMARILTWSRIHEPAFWLTAVQMVFATSLIVATFGALGWAIVSFNGALASWVFLAIVVSGIMSVMAWATIRRSVIETSDSAGDIPNVSVPRFVAALLIVAVAQGVYAIACTLAIFSKSVSWRGVTYTIQDRKVVLNEYVPYEGQQGSSQSI